MEELSVLYFLNIISAVGHNTTRSTTAVDPQHLESRISRRVGYQSNKKLLAY